jgi:hypothetical protein
MLVPVCVRKQAGIQADRDLNGFTPAFIFKIELRTENAERFIAPSLFFAPSLPRIF